MRRKPGTPSRPGGSPGRRQSFGRTIDAEPSEQRRSDAWAWGRAAMASQRLIGYGRPQVDRAHMARWCAGARGRWGPAPNTSTAALTPRASPPPAPRPRPPARREAALPAGDARAAGDPQIPEDHRPADPPPALCAPGERAPSRAPRAAAPGRGHRGERWGQPARALGPGGGRSEGRGGHMAPRALHAALASGHRGGLAMPTPAAGAAPPRRCARPPTT